MVETKNSRRFAPESTIRRSMDIFFVPAHGFTQREYELGFFNLRRGFARAGLNLMTSEWIKGENTKPADQITYLHRVIRNSHQRHSFEPFALAGHSRGAQVVLEEANKIVNSDFGDRLTGVILLSPAPYYEPVFTSFKNNAANYPSDYSKYPQELKQSLEGLELPSLPKDLPIVIFSGRQETLFNHQVEGAMLYEYRGHSEYHEVPTHRRWHPYLTEYAPIIAEFGSSVSGINDPLYNGLPPEFNEAQIKWTPGDGIQFARLPRGRVAIRNGNGTVAGTFPPGLWVNFIDNLRNGSYNEINAA